MKPGTLEKTGLAVIAAALGAGMVFDAFLPAACAVAAALVLVLVAGSSFRTLLAALAVQIIFMAGQLDSMKSAIGVPVFTPDELLLLWSGFLWIVALAEGRASIRRKGTLGSLILVYVLLATIATARGMAAGYPVPGIIALTKTNLSYLCYFPALWLLGDEHRVQPLMKLLLVCSVVAGIVFFYKGITGTGEGVHYLTASGLRVGSRQVNVFAVVMMILLARLWMSPKRPPLALALPVVVLLGGCIILAATRAIWAGVALAVALAWILGFFRKDGVPGGVGRHALVLVFTAAAVVLAIFTVSAMGIISTAQMATRLGSGGSSSIPIDVGLLARLISWATILDQAGGLPGMLFGHGTGFEITCFKPEFGEIWTMYYVDGSFWQVLLNMGLAGVASLGLIYGVALLQAARLFLNTRDRERSSRALGVFCSLVVLLVASMLGSLLTNYNYVALWAVLLAILQLERDREAGARAGIPHALPVGPGDSPSL